MLRDGEAADVVLELSGELGAFVVLDEEIRRAGSFKFRVRTDCQESPELGGDLGVGISNDHYETHTK